MFQIHLQEWTPCCLGTLDTIRGIMEEITMEVMVMEDIALVVGDMWTTLITIRFITKIIYI